MLRLANNGDEGYAYLLRFLCKCVCLQKCDCPERGGLCVFTCEDARGNVFVCMCRLI